MALSLDKIKKNQKASRSKKRVGRGNAHGQGTYCGRGLKGQNARAGVSNLKRLGMKQVLLRTPKMKGFKSKKAKNQIVNLVDINKHFKNGEEINPQILLKKGLIDNISIAVKILGTGKLQVKKLKFKDVLMSESVKKQIK